MDIRYKTVESLQAKLRQLTKAFRYTIDGALEDTGDTCKESQRICLLNHLNALEAQIEGIMEEDMK